MQPIISKGITAYVTWTGCAVIASITIGCGGATTAPHATTKPQDGTGTIGEAAIAQGGIGTLDRNRGAALPSGELTFRFHGIPAEAPLKLDGILREWPPLTPATVAIQGVPGPSPHVSFALSYDNTKIWVAGDVTAESFRRTTAFAEAEDHAVLLLAIPNAAGSYAAYCIALYAGKPGESAGVVRFGSGPQKGRDVPGARILESAKDGGYTFEAVVPWAAFPESRTTRVGLRGALRYVTRDSSEAPLVLATGPGDVNAAITLPFLPIESEQSLFDGLLTPKGVATNSARFDVFADLTGNGKKERVAVFDRFVTITGADYRGGTQFFYREMPGDIVRIEAHDLSSQGPSILFVLTKTVVNDTSHDTMEVWGFHGDEPTTLFAREIAVSKGSQRLSNSITFSGKTFEIRPEPAVGWDRDSFREAAVSNAEPLLAPWDGVQLQVFRYDGKAIVKSKEVGHRTSTTPRRGPAVEQEATTVNPAPPPPAPPPSGPSRDESETRLLTQYRRDHGIDSNVAPRFDLRGNVAGDAQLEHVALFNRDLVVFGTGFNGGSRYIYFTLETFATPDDIQDVSLRDVAGDGSAAIVVTGKRTITDTSGAKPTTQEAMLVYRVTESSITRTFGVEVARTQDGKRVQSKVLFTPARNGKALDITVQPDKATGWTEATYPWNQDTPGAGPLEPLLLPWGTTKQLQYRLDNGKYVLSGKPHAKN